MTKKHATLPARWSSFLHDQPETGMGYQVVSITLDDGTRIEDVAIIECHIIGEIRNQPERIVDPERILGVQVTHRKWQFRR